MYKFCINQINKIQPNFVIISWLKLKCYPSKYSHVLHWKILISISEREPLYRGSQNIIMWDLVWNIWLRKTGLIQVTIQIYINTRRPTKATQGAANYVRKTDVMKYDSSFCWSLMIEIVIGMIMAFVLLQNNHFTKSLSLCNIILMAQQKTVVTPVLKHWSYHSLVLNISPAYHIIYQRWWSHPVANFQQHICCHRIWLPPQMLHHTYFNS